MEILKVVSVGSLLLSLLSAIVVAADIRNGHRQNMAIMNWVWPITTIWAGPLGLWAYFRFGRAPANKPALRVKTQKKSRAPSWQVITVGDLHCAAGCTVGDVAGEWLVFLTGVTVAGSLLWTDYLTDFVLAYTAGIVFQYFAIAPMRELFGWPGIMAAIKADTVSLIAFEIGMFSWMAFSHEILFEPSLKPTDPAYWFMMQIAMAVGFITAYPANMWLIRKGIKESM
jgi:hypothetical protein